MKYMKRILAALLALQLFLPVMTMPAQAAAVKNGLVKVRDTSDEFVKDYNYYFYKKGTMVKKQWKTIREKGKKYKYYFGKKGAANKAKALFDGSYNVKVFRINGKKYGFDMNAHLVSEGIYVDQASKIWVFKKGGVYDNQTTKALRNRFKNYDAGGIRSTELYDELVCTLGKPVSESTAVPCASWDGLDFAEFTVVVLNYNCYSVQLLRRDKTGEYGVLGFFADKP